MDSSMKSIPPPIYVVSGGVGESGEQLARTVLAQFPDAHVPIIIIGRVLRGEQVERAVETAAQTGGTLVHTLVDSGLRSALIEAAHRQGVMEIDLMGGLIERLSQVLGQQPVGKPGLYRELHKAYYTRVEAMEYSIDHDDGARPEGWADAELLLIGVSRSGKTPLSLYMAVMGWKVANYPFVNGVEPPIEIHQMDLRRVVGLTIEPGQLILHRKERQSRLGVSGATDYTDPAAVYEEVEAARKFFRRNGFTIVDITDKPIESSADEIIRKVTRLIHGGSEKLSER